jgi:enoyl-CoA hydratase/carnithine racemase
MSDTVLIETRDYVRTLTMNRPEARNAFSSEQWSALRDALADASADNGVRVVILTGAGKAFTAGVDLTEMAAPPGGGEHPFGSCMEQVIDFDKPLIAAVNGVGVGFGLTVLLHCDMALIAAGARLKVPFVSLGVVPEAASSYLLPLQVGPQNAAEILYTAGWVTSSRAVEVGLALREVAPEDLMAEALALAARVAVHPLGSLRHTKQLVRAGRIDAIRAARQREDAGFAVRVGSPENVEAITAFLQKRPADFSNIDPD